MTDRPSKRAVLYARKSTIDKAAWASLESQLEIVRDGKMATVKL